MVELARFRGKISIDSPMCCVAGSVWLADADHQRLPAKVHEKTGHSIPGRAGDPAVNHPQFHSIKSYKIAGDLIKSRGWIYGSLWAP